MRIRRALFALVLDRAERDEVPAYTLAHMCGTSRTRASALLHGRIELFNSETLIDILARMGVIVDVDVKLYRPYPRTNLPNPRFPFASPDVEEGYTK
jgi:predicted XRE-type DNA-binding protein